ncbi:MAG: InlB B-repeat-containing protein [Planctomycetota bacterium]|jgi:hypothetical protein
MEKKNLIYTGSQKSILVAVLVLFVCGLPELAHCETNGPVLLLQQIPANGGTITPDSGVHHVELNSHVTLTAIPRPGYQFIYWLGDVSDPTLNRTTTYLNAPKIIVAVFERAEFELGSMVEIGQGIPGSFVGGMRASARDYSQQGYKGGGAPRPSTRRASPPLPEPPLPPQIVPVPIPEPATVVLLAVGGYLALAGRRLRK